MSPQLRPRKDCDRWNESHKKAPALFCKKLARLSQKPIIALISRYSSIPNTPISRPLPDFL
jgi:hypothetical protein